MIKTSQSLSVVTHICNSRLSGARDKKIKVWGHQSKKVIKTLSKTNQQWWYSPVIPTTQVVEILNSKYRSWILDHGPRTDWEKAQDPIYKINETKEDGVMAQVVEYKTLSTSPSTIKIDTKKERTFKELGPNDRGESYSILICEFLVFPSIGRHHVITNSSHVTLK
jgi:hypothetical protein